MTSPPVLVVVPAHNEQDTVADCLTAVLDAAGHARRRGVVASVRIVLAAHRCTDATASAAHAVLAGGDHLVVVIDESLTVGEVRSRAVAAAGPLPPDGWILSTDADSLVPPDWIERLLAVGEAASADLVAGLTSLAGWSAEPAARDAYARLLAAKMTADGHDHVYAANLAVRVRAYQAVGGFPALAHGEEQGLADAIRAAGGRVVGALEPVVLTSARMPGRAAAGLGALLAEISQGRA